MKVGKNLLGLAILVLSNTAQANWLTDEWRAFRTHPRLNNAYEQFKKGDMVASRKMLDEVKRIDPNNRDAQVLYAQVCAKQEDLDCLESLGNDWLKRYPQDALGAYVLAYRAQLRHDMPALAQFSGMALRGKGLSAARQTNAAKGWMQALLHQSKHDEAQAALEWITAHAVAVSTEEQNRWHAALGKPAAQAQSSKQPPSHSQSSTTKPHTVEAKQGSVTEFPYAGLATKERNTKLTTDLVVLIGQKQFKLLEQRVQSIKTAGLWTPALQESVALNLQAHNCDLLLALVPPGVDPRQTSERAQLAAAYCSAAAPTMAAQYFANATQLRRSSGDAAQPDILRAQGNAWAQAGEYELALQRWAEVLQLRFDAPLAQQAVRLALQNPVLPSSPMVIDRYASALPSGEYALWQARRSRAQGELLVAKQQYSHSLAQHPSADVYEEYAALLAQMGDDAAVGVALAQALQLDSKRAQTQAQYAYWAKAHQQNELALTHFESAYSLDAQRVELLPEMAHLQTQLGLHDEAAKNWRLALDHQPTIAAKQKLGSDAVQIQSHAWKSELREIEDPWSGSISAQTRLNRGPDGQAASSPLEYAQYGGSLNADIAYRLPPKWVWDAAHPTWLFGRASQGLQDRSLQLTEQSALLGLGVRQRLLKDEVLMASAEWLLRQGASHRSDVMLRLSGSRSAGLGWQPAGDRWTSYNLYGDAAWLLRAASYYGTLTGELGQMMRLSGSEPRMAWGPYLSAGLQANNDNPQHLSVSRFDLGVGVALQSWHGGDRYRAESFNQRLVLEWRQAVGGNARDRATVLVRWSLAH